MAEILALIADAHPEFAQGEPSELLETTGEWGDAAEFCAALERYCASHPRSWRVPVRGRPTAAA
ncbi:MAG: hypothetical protein J2P49_04790 [Methylocapsa sp.]|nr:hypothetical protein [Methylocapsa sp.]